MAGKKHQNCWCHNTSDQKSSGLNVYISFTYHAENIGKKKKVKYSINKEAKTFHFLDTFCANVSISNICQGENLVTKPIAKSFDNRFFFLKLVLG